MRSLPHARAAAALAACLCAVMLACTGANGAPASGRDLDTGTPGPAADTTATQRSLPAFDGARAWEDLRRQVALGPRPSGSPASAATRQYIVDQLEAAGIATREQAFASSTPLGEVLMANVIGTIPGRRPERVILASHYDTKLYAEFPFVGANDGGSSTAALLELGRALSHRQHEFTIELLFLDGEEARRTVWEGQDNTYGSRHYVQAGRKDGSLGRVAALILLDMIGDRDLVIRRDANSTPWLVEAVWSAAARLGHGATFSNQLTTIEDDHIPFLRAGVAAVDLIDLDNPTWHTPQDTLEYVSERSLQIVGDVVLAALPDIERRLLAQK